MCVGRIRTPAEEYDRARPSSAENSQQELALHQANLRANIAARAECQNSHAACTVAVPTISARQVLKLQPHISRDLHSNDQSRDVRRCSGGKPETAQPRASRGSLSSHCNGDDDHTDHLGVDPSNGGGTSFSSIPSEAAENIFDSVEDNSRRRLNYSPPDSIAGAHTRAVTDNREILKTVSSDIMDVNAPSMAVASVTLQTKTLAEGITYCDPEARSRELIAPSAGLCGGDIPSTKNVEQNYSKMAMHDAVDKQSTTPRSSTTSSSCEPRDSRAVRTPLHLYSSTEHSTSIAKASDRPKTQNAKRVPAENGRMKQKGIGEIGSRDNSETRSRNRGELYSSNSSSLSIPPSPNRPPSPAAPSSSKSRSTTGPISSRSFFSGSQTSYHHSPLTSLPFPSPASQLAPCDPLSSWDTVSRKSALQSDAYDARASTLAPVSNPTHPSGLPHAPATPKHAHDVPTPSSAARRGDTVLNSAAATLIAVHRDDSAPASVVPAVTHLFCVVSIPWARIDTRSCGFGLWLAPPFGSRQNALPPQSRSMPLKIDAAIPLGSSIRCCPRVDDVVPRDRTSGRCRCLESSFIPAQLFSPAAPRPSHHRVRYNGKDPPWRIGSHPENAARAPCGYKAFRASTSAWSALVFP
ncbi:hypothetical protein B0H13DRAFT_2315410 [Mycena leptocephala]|nr:hypothetical protein B0H13DRAFT_2315410 [Mycena leptocephala]